MKGSKLLTHDLSCGIGGHGHNHNLSMGGGGGGPKPLWGGGGGGGGGLAVDFGTPRELVTLWFELHYGTNPPLGTLMI
jgi:hypothetical protein